MNIIYFKPRDRFDFSKDTMNIGNPLTWDHSHFLKYLFKRIFTVPERRLKEFYNHHLDYYLVFNTDGSEELFFINLWELIERQLKVLAGKIYTAKTTLVHKGNSISQILDQAEKLGGIK